jgi:uncharacterized Rmd1/YagE family protein
MLQLFELRPYRSNDAFKERAEILKRKLDTIVETARTLTDMIDANRATRLEATVVILIMAEILLTIGQIISGGIEAGAFGQSERLRVLRGKPSK